MLCSIFLRDNVRSLCKIYRSHCIAYQSSPTARAACRWQAAEGDMWSKRKVELQGQSRPPPPPPPPPRRSPPPPPRLPAAPPPPPRPPLRLCFSYRMMWSSCRPLHLQGVKAHFGSLIGLWPMRVSSVSITQGSCRSVCSSSSRRRWSRRFGLAALAPLFSASVQCRCAPSDTFSLLAGASVRLTASCIFPIRELYTTLAAENMVFF